MCTLGRGGGGTGFAGALLLPHSDSTTKHSAYLCFQVLCQVRAGKARAAFKECGAPTLPTARQSGAGPYGKQAPGLSLQHTPVTPPAEAQQRPSRTEYKPLKDKLPENKGLREPNKGLEVRILVTQY